MAMTKLCKDCEEEIDATRLRLFPLADKCSDCAAPLSSEMNKSLSKHLPSEALLDFEYVESHPPNLKKDNLDVRRKKPVLDMKSYECPFCESKVKVRQLNQDQYKLSCKECGWFDYFPPRKKMTNLFRR